MNRRTDDLAVVFDVDLAALLIYSGQPVVKATVEGGRVGFWFPASAVAAQQQELAAGNATVEVGRWSATVRRLHADYLSRSAKTAMRSGQDGTNGRRHQNLR